MGKIAFTHPGKMGDALYSLPVMRKICEDRNTICDFYTSSYCEPMRRLFEYQSFVDRFIVPPQYRVERMDMGCQPWYMPVPETLYDVVYHLGFRGIPDRAIHQYIASTIGIYDPLAIRYEYPYKIEPVDRPYICIAPRGETTYSNLFNEIAQYLTCIVIGGKGDYIGHGIDGTGLDMLDTLSILHHAQGFVGLMSSQLVLANGFDIPKIAPHDGRSWDMRHVVYTDKNHYPINPNIDTILQLLKEG